LSKNFDEYIKKIIFGQVCRT